MIFLRLLLSALFLAAGTLHLADPALFLPIMPPMIPCPRLCIILSGLLELAGGLGLLMPDPRLRRLAALGLSLLLVAVFPANVYMAMEHVQIHGFPSRPWIAWARLPLQPLLIFAVLWATRPPSPRRP